VTGPATTVEHAEAAARLRVVVARLARQLRQTSPGGLTLSQWSALVTIEKQDRLRIGDLAEREGFSAPTATRLVAGLEEQGLLQRSGDPDDRRTAYVSLTPAGTEKLEWARSMRTLSLAKRLSTLPEGSVDRLMEMLPLLEMLLTDD
jgi:DNA-binding MarR family transcriptional regulator